MMYKITSVMQSIKVGCDVLKEKKKKEQKLKKTKSPPGFRTLRIPEAFMRQTARQRRRASWRVDSAMITAQMLGVFR